MEARMSDEEWQKIYNIWTPLYDDIYENELKNSPSIAALKLLYPKWQKYPSQEFISKNTNGFRINGLGKETNIIYNINDKTFTYEVTANKKILKTETDATLEGCLEKLVEYIKDRKNTKDKPKLTLTKEELDKNPTMQALYSIATPKRDAEVYTIHPKGIQFGQSFGSRLRVDYNENGTFTYNVVSGGSIIKTETFSNLNDCLEAIYIYVLCKKYPTIFGVSKKELNAAFDECILKKNPIPLNDLIMNSKDYMKNLNIIQSSLPIIWAELEKLHKDSSSFKLATTLGNIGF